MFLKWLPWVVVIAKLWTKKYFCGFSIGDFINLNLMYTNYGSHIFYNLWTVFIIYDSYFCSFSCSTIYEFISQRKQDNLSNKKPHLFSSFGCRDTCFSKYDTKYWQCSIFWNMYMIWNIHFLPILRLIDKKSLCMSTMLNLNLLLLWAELNYFEALV